jgi:hypothetical protein
MGKSTISMAIFHSYFDITRGYGKYGARHLLGSQKWCRSIHLRSKTSLSTPELSVGAAQTFSGARNFREVGAQEVRCQQLCCLLAWQWSGTCNNQTSKSHIPMIDNWAFMMDILYVIFFWCGSYMQYVSISGMFTSPQTETWQIPDAAGNGMCCAEHGFLRGQMSCSS